MASVLTGAFYSSRWWRARRLECLVRDGWCCSTPGCQRRASIADHRTPRPHVPSPCAADALTNLRSLCSVCDARVKELSSGGRRNGGVLAVRGARVDGWPNDPSRC